MIINRLRENSEIFTLAEFYTMVMSLIYIILTFVFWNQVENIINTLAINISVIIGIIIIAKLAFPYLNNPSIYLLKKVYIAPLLWVVYSQIHTFIPIVNPHDYDNEY